MAHLSYSQSFQRGWDAEKQPSVYTQGWEAECGGFSSSFDQHEEVCGVSACSSVFRCWSLAPSLAGQGIERGDCAPDCTPTASQPPACCQHDHFPALVLQSSAQPWLLASCAWYHSGEHPNSRLVSAPLRLSPQPQQRKASSWVPSLPGDWGRC